MLEPEVAEDDARLPESIPGRGRSAPGEPTRNAQSTSSLTSPSDLGVQTV